MQAAGIQPAMARWFGPCPPGGLQQPEKACPQSGGNTGDGGPILGRQRGQRFVTDGSDGTIWNIKVTDVG